MGNFLRYWELGLQYIFLEDTFNYRILKAHKIVILLEIQGLSKFEKSICLIHHLIRIREKK